MTGDDLPSGDHVVRYVKPTSVRRNGTVDGSAFCLRPNDSSLSVHWLERFGGGGKDERIDEVRRLSRLTMRERGRLAELPVGTTRQHLLLELEDVRFIHAPLNADAVHEADPSHSEITGLPPGDSPRAELIGDMMAECVRTVHPAVKAP